MKNPLHTIMIAATSVIVASIAMAHDGMHPDRPNPSPNAMVAQEVGHGKVTVEYGSPGVKGREGKIWGDLVPYNEGKPRPWGAGANGNAVITFSEDVKLNGQAIAAGSYGMLMIPAAEEWTIIFSKNSTRLGILHYTPDEDVLRLTVKPEKAPFREWLAFEFDKQGDFSSKLRLHWEELSVGFEIEAAEHGAKAAE